MNNFEAELDALQRWIKATANLNSIRLQAAPPKVARPIILWESAGRRRDRNLGRYQYVNKVSQFGKLYVVSLDQALELQEVLFSDIEERVGVLPVYNKAGAEVAKLKAVDLTFTETDTLDIPLKISYEATYGRVRPADPGPARSVTGRISVQGKEFITIICREV